MSSLETDHQTQKHYLSTATHDSFTSEETIATRLQTEQTTPSKVTDESQDDPVDSWEDRVESDSPDTSAVAVKTMVPPETSALVPAAGDMTSGAVNTQVEKEVKLNSQKEGKVSLENSDRSKTINTSTASESPSSGSSTKDKSRGNKSDAGTTIKQNVSQIQAVPKPKDDKENVNIIFIGHVDAGKSTIGGHVM